MAIPKEYKQKKKHTKWRTRARGPIAISGHCVCVCECGLDLITLALPNIHILFFLCLFWYFVNFSIARGALSIFTRCVGAMLASASKQICFYIIFFFGAERMREIYATHISGCMELCKWHRCATAHCDTHSYTANEFKSLLPLPKVMGGTEQKTQTTSNNGKYFAVWICAGISLRHLNMIEKAHESRS